MFHVKQFWGADGRLAINLDPGFSTEVGAKMFHVKQF
jgi:hypothetical protein